MRSPTKNRRTTLSKLEKKNKKAKDKKVIDTDSNKSELNSVYDDDDE